MKQALIPVIVLCLSAAAAHAQQDRPICGTDYHFRQVLMDNPSLVETVKAGIEKINETARQIAATKKTPPDSVRYIPMVFHMVHAYGAERIGLDQIQSGIDKLNRDFRRLNSDTAQTRDVFKPFAADCYFEFRLAKIDPNGNCTDGMTYWESPLTNMVWDTMKSVIQWPPEKYFNIWVVTSIDAARWGLSGTILGYEEFPWQSNIGKTYGAVVVHKYWGNKGTAVANNSRTETHEMGHCFGLWHPFQDQSIGGIGDGCTFIAGNDCSDNGDMVCDTPPMTAPTYGCDKLQNTCPYDTVGPSPFATDTVDPIENYMSYDNCQNMFSAGQKQRMDAVFLSYPKLTNLISYANAVATGTDTAFVPQLCSPHADFITDKRYVCQGATVKYTDMSWNGAPSSWSWQFPGGTPATSAAASPTITYNTPGSYDATLVVQNASGSDTLTLKNRVYVSSATSDLSAAEYKESFEDTAVVNNLWFLETNAGGNRWEVTGTAAYSGSQCLMINNFDRIWMQEKLAFVTPSYNMSAVSNPELSFKVAYARIDNLSADKIRIYASTTCGGSWVLRSSKTGTALISAPDKTTPFVPSSTSEWLEIVVPLSGAYATGTNVRFRIEFEAFLGNHIYIDDFHIRDKTLSVGESPLNGNISLYPNPAGDAVTLSLDLKNDVSAQISVHDVLGREVLAVVRERNLVQGRNEIHFDTGALRPGVYVVRLQFNGYTESVRLIIRH